MIKKHEAFFLFILCCLFVFCLTGCKSSNKHTETRQKPTGTLSQPAAPTIIPTEIPTKVPTNIPSIPPTMTPTPTPATTPTVTPAPTATPTITSTMLPDVTPSVTEGNDSQATDQINLSQFRSLTKCFIDYEFDVNTSDLEDMPNSFEVEGSFDLNSDGQTDEIKLELKGYYNTQSYIEVNGVRKEFYIDSSVDGEVRIVDLDRNDDFLEVACFDEGPSGDPNYELLRYDGSRIYDLGDIDSGALMDGKGKLISSFHMTRKMTPAFCSAWYEIDNNALTRKNNDIEPYLGLTYVFAGGEAYFIPFDKLPEHIDTRWGETRNFKPGKVKIIDILYLDSDNRIIIYYFVEFPNGETGLLYFWIGD